MIEGSLEVKLPTIWTDEKQSREEAERRERLEERRVRRKKMQMREKVGKSRNTVFFQWFGAPEGRKVGSLKRRVRSQLARWEMKNCTRCGAKHISKSKCTKHTRCGPLLAVEMWKVHAVVARSAFPSQNVQSTPGADHFWQLRCRKRARRCGAKHISKSKCTKHTRCGPLLAVEMSKNCTPLWREAHFQVKMYKTPQCRTTFGSWDVEKVHAVVARSTFWSQHVKNTRGSDHFWKLRCRFASLDYTTLHYTTLHSITLHYTTLHYTPLHYNYNYTTTLHYTTLHYTKLHYTTLHHTRTTTTTTTIQLQLYNYTPLHSTTLHYTPLHHTTLHYTTLHYTTLHYITLHYTPLHYNYNHNYTTTLYYTPLHSTTLNYTTLHYITLHYITLHYTPLHYTTLHYTTLPSTTLHYITLHSTTATTTATQLHSTTLHYTPLH